MKKQIPSLEIIQIKVEKMTIDFIKDLIITVLILIIIPPNVYLLFHIILKGIMPHLVINP